MDIIDTIMNIAVKIECSEGEKKREGTGTIISNGDHYYVMTAGHCIKKDDNTVFKKESICITTGTKIKVNVMSIIDFDLSEAKDFALLSVEKPNTNIDYSVIVKRCDELVDDEEYRFYGYGGLNTDGGRMFQVERRGPSLWHLVDDNINNQDLTAMNLIGGFSGSGLFFQRHGLFYFVGYVKALQDEDGANNDLTIYPTSNFDECLPMDTKEINLFKLVEKWTRLDQNSLDDQEVENYKESHGDYWKNLVRKIQVLYPHKQESKENLDKQINSYLKGLKLVDEIRKSSNILTLLNKAEVSTFTEHGKIRSKYFNTANDARQDLAQFRDSIKDAAKEVFIGDDYKDIINSFSDYDIANRLLDCSLDYRDEDEN